MGRISYFKSLQQVFTGPEMWLSRENRDRREAEDLRPSSFYPFRDEL